MLTLSLLHQAEYLISCYKLSLFCGFNKVRVFILKASVAAAVSLVMDEATYTACQ